MVDALRDKIKTLKFKKFSLSPPNDKYDNNTGISKLKHK
jgi:hypothetical protein